MTKDYMTIPISYKQFSIEKVKELIQYMGTEINFDADTWICDKLKKSEVQSSKEYTLYFKNTPVPYDNIVRYFAIALFNKGNKIKTIILSVTHFITFIKFIMTEYGYVDLTLVDSNILNSYKEYLDIIYTSSDTKHSKWSSVSNFFRVMKSIDSKFVINPVMNNPFIKKKNNPDKYISKYILDQTDELFKNQDIPLHLRTTYWIMRFIPSRLGEVVEANIDCIRTIADGWILTLPSWKQNGGYDQPENRLIRFKKESLEGTYLINLILEQQRIARSLQSSVDDRFKGYLFTYKQYGLYNTHFKQTGKRKYYERENIIVASSITVEKFFRHLGEYYNIHDEERKPSYFTSHMLRHNGITDRLHEGFEAVHIRTMTKHKNDMMIVNNYLHPQKDILNAKQRLLFDSDKQTSEETDKSIVYFNGKILNLDSMMEKRLLRNIRAHKLKYGICSDITGCKNKYDCLGCNFFIPRVEDLNYFEEEISQWAKKVEFFRSQKHFSMEENARHNMELNQKVVDKIKGYIKTNAFIEVQDEKRNT